MNKLRIFAMTALAAATIGVGGLVAAPSASAMPRDCEQLAIKAQAYYDTANVLHGLGSFTLASFYYGKSTAYFEMATECLGG